MVKVKDGEAGFMLFDFDWAGKIGEVRYPYNVNRQDIWRPDAVRDKELVKADHDMQMLGSLFGPQHV